MSNETYVPFPDCARFFAAVEVPPAVAAFEAMLEELRSTSSEEALLAARRRMTEYAAIETGALEGLYDAGRGFTITVAANAAVIEAIRGSRGDTVARIVQDQLAAFELVLDLATERSPVTESFLRQLHEVLCRSQPTYRVYTAHGPQDHELVAGAYKRLPNNPYRAMGEIAHAYAPVVDTAPEMARLVAELRTPTFLQTHPVLQAAYAHFGFVSVHPFADGNGRVARALASIYTYRRPGVPLVIFDDEKADYLRSLELADEGRLQPFVDFAAERVIETIQLVKEQVDSAAGGGPADVLSRLGRTVRAGIGDLTHLQADALATGLQGQLAQALVEWERDARFPEGISVHAVHAHGAPSSSTPGGYRPVLNNPSYVDFTVLSVPPATASVRVLVVPFVSQTQGQMYDFLLTPSSDDPAAPVLEPFGVRVKEVQPHTSQALTTRLNGWARRLATAALSRAADEAETSLRNSGYRS